MDAAREHEARNAAEKNADANESADDPGGTGRPGFKNQHGEDEGDDAIKHQPAGAFHPAEVEGHHDFHGCFHEQINGQHKSQRRHARRRMRQHVDTDGDINDAQDDSPPEAAAMVMAYMPGVGELHRAAKHQQPAKQEHERSSKNFGHDDGTNANNDHKDTDDDRRFGCAMDGFVCTHIAVFKFP